jgi:two-component system chemotaxis response regulator CheB
MAKIPAAFNLQSAAGVEPNATEPEARHDIIVIGGSSGALEALKEIVAGLPADLPAAVFIVVHVPAHGTSWLPDILSRAGQLPARHAKDTEPIERGRICVAPPDFHLLLGEGCAQVVRGPKENNHRPAVDALFRSAASFYGPRVVGVVLSGALDDGAAGLFSIKNRGGIAIVQDPEDALFPDMPRAALSAVPVDHCVPKREISNLLAELARQPVDAIAEDNRFVAGPEKIKKETALAALNTEVIEDQDKPGKPSAYACPDCGGVLWEVEENDRLRFRCRVGHAFGAEALMASQTASLESALWSAFRGLHETAALNRRLAKRAYANNQLRAAKKFETTAQQTEEHAELIRHLLLHGEKAGGETRATGQ